MGLRDFVFRQLGDPHGLMAPVMSALFNRGNRSLIQDAIAAAGVRSGDVALDIGFGGGVSLAWLLESVGPPGRVRGVDPSMDMVDPARRRFSEPIRAGRLTVDHGAVEATKLDDASIDAAISCNTFYFWPDPAAGAAEVLRVLRPGGRLVLGNRTVKVLRGFGFTDAEHNLLDDAATAAIFRDAGFSEFEARASRDKVESRLYVATK